jgi:hypothetical protein
VLQLVFFSGWRWRYLHPGIGGKFLKTRGTPLMRDRPAQYRMAEGIQIRFPVHHGGHRLSRRRRQGNVLRLSRRLGIGCVSDLRRWRGYCLKANPIAVLRNVTKNDDRLNNR